MKLTALHEASHKYETRFSDRGYGDPLTNDDIEFTKLVRAQVSLWREIRTQTGGEGVEYDKIRPEFGEGEWWSDEPIGYASIDSKREPADARYSIDSSAGSKRLRTEWRYLMRDIGRLLPNVNFKARYEYNKLCTRLQMPEAKPIFPEVPEQPKLVKRNERGKPKVVGGRDTPDSWRQYSRGMRNKREDTDGI